MFKYKVLEESRKRQEKIGLFLKKIFVRTKTFRTKIAAPVYLAAKYRTGGVAATKNAKKSHVVQ
jgi:hypothetical protein